MSRLKNSWVRAESRTTDLLTLGCILVFFLCTFPQGILGGRFLLSNDAFFYSFPLRTVAWRMIRSGELPLWTPTILSGYPLLSMAQIGLAYPLTWGYLVFTGRTAEQIYVLAPFLLVPLFTYFYLRSLGRSPLASLLGGLSFGYGGMMASPLANNGLMPNAVMWLPLLLIAIERSRTTRFVSALLLATFAFSMSVLTGLGQGFVLVGLISVCYACFVAIACPSEVKLFAIERWRPLFVVVLAAAMSMGVAAFQLLETARAVRRSIRSNLNFDILTQGSLTPMQLWQSIVKPLLFGVDTYAFISPLAIVLALLAITNHIRRHNGRDPRIFFWTALALLALFLMMGRFTPLYTVVYHVPVLNRFRVPSRHTFEWTFAIAVLAAYGWDIVSKYLQSKATVHKQAPWESVVLLMASVAVGVIWWKQVAQLRGVRTPSPSANNIYLILKLSFFLLTTATLWRASIISNTRQRFFLALCAVLFLSFIEPASLIRRWWGTINLSAARFETMADATRYLQQFPANENRCYTRVDLFSEQYETQPRVDGPNLSAIYNLQNVAGYEPLILDRYSRALGNVGVDSVRQIAQYAVDDSLLDSRSHVLDILNTRHVATYSNLAASLEPITLSNAAASLQSLGELEPMTTKNFGAPSVEADTLLLITSLANSVDIPQGTNVGRLRISLADGRVVDYILRAGIDTSEWAHERADVKSEVQHSLATVFDGTAVSGPPAFTAYRFKTLVPLGGLTRVSSVKIENLTKRARLALYGATI
ncbi:MAG: hypothetical protein C5B55_00225, partial [Blastocatellia bacterium]